MGVNRNLDSAKPATQAPGPGMLELLRSLTGLRDDPLAFLQDASERYGELVQFKLGPLNAFVLTRPDDIQHVLQDNNHNYSKDTLQYNALAKVTGRGLLTSDGDVWLRQRRRLQPAFHRQHIQSFGPLMVEAAARKTDDWQEPCQSGVVIDMDREMMELALEILGKALLGVDLRTDAPTLTAAVLVALDHLVYSLKSPDIVPNFIPTPRKRRFQQAVQTLDRAVQEIVETHRRTARDSRASLLDAMLQPPDGSPPMTDQQIRDELITILIAGHETVASALTWTCYLLAQNPPVALRLHQELDHVLQGRLPTVSDLPELEVTRRVFDEALRLYPPAWLVTRKSLQADVIQGVHIPPNSLMVISIAGAHKNPAVWSDPTTFDPDRFLPQAIAARPKLAYLPFGAGPRLCIGNHFALVEAPLVLATIYQRYYLDLATDQPVITDALVTQRPRGGLPMRVRSRKV